MQSVSISAIGGRGRFSRDAIGTPHYACAKLENAPEGSDYAAFSQAKRRMEAQLREDKRLAAIAKRIANRIMSHVET